MNTGVGLGHKSRSRTTEEFCLLREWAAWGRSQKAGLECQRECQLNSVGVMEGL